MSSSFQYLAWLQMAVAQRNAYFEAGTLDAVGTVVGLDLASVHFYKCLAEVESDTGSFDMETAAVVSLIETFEEAVGLLFLQSDACIFYLMMAFFSSLPMITVISPPSKVYFMALESRLEITLSKLMRSIQTFSLPLSLAEAFVFFELKCDVALFCIETVERYDAVQEILERSFLTMEMHLVFVYLSLVKNLVYQKQQALGIAVYRIDILFAFGIRYSCLQLVEGSHNQCQR